MRNRYIATIPAAGVTFASHIDFTWNRVGGVHNHGEMQVLVPTSGVLTLGVGDTVHHLPPGDIAVIPARLRHAVPAVDDPSAASLIDLRFRLDQRNDVTTMLRKHKWPLVLHASPHDALAFARELDEAATADVVSEAALMRSMWTLLTIIDRARIGAGQPTLDHRVAVAERFMLQNLVEPLSAEQIADACELSVSQLNRLFHQHRRVGPVARLRQMRVDRARELLAASLLSVKEIARDCGFVCPNHFCRVFKEEVTLTPGDYRKRAGHARVS